MRQSPPHLATSCYVWVAASSLAFIWTLSVTTQATQTRSVTAPVYSGEQATRGQQTYHAQCVTCHGDTLAGLVGPPLAGEAFFSTWGGRSVKDLVDKIENTMPPQAAVHLSRQQATDIAAYLLQVGGFPAGQDELTAVALTQVAFPPARSAPGSNAAAGSAASPFVVAGNLAQIMRAITFPNANILFNVQIKDPGAQPVKQPAAAPFDYVEWGSTIYPGWQAVDQAALALIESTPLFMLPGRRCENGRAAPIDRADYVQYTDALVQVARDAYKASQARSQDALVELSDKLNDACANCHKVYRDAAQEGTGRVATRCQ
jgi:S-disulfanyl-L-cysteine oxidoreductase SoxD